MITDMIYQEKPENFVVDFEAVGCFVQSGEKILQLLRSPEAKVEPLKWGCPAGKIENAETAETAMLRELREETGLRVAPSQLIFAKSFWVMYPESKFTYRIFRLTFLDIPLITLSPEHLAFVWIPLQGLSAIDLMQDELACAKLVFGF